MSYETVALVKNEVFVYRIGPIGAGGHKAADWKLDEPDWTGRMRLIALGEKLELRLEDKSTGQLFAKAPVDAYPGSAVEAVTDSSRYFVVRLINDNGATAFIGIGFADRSDSFDMNVALMEHFKYLDKSAAMEKEAAADVDKPALDLAFKAGQTITISLGSQKEGSTARPKVAAGGVVPKLAPPPGSSRKL